MPSVPPIAVSQPRARRRAAHPCPWAVDLVTALLGLGLGVTIALDVGRRRLAARRVVATSAHYERGPHIVAPQNDETQPEMTTVTVVAGDLGWADGWATALFAAGASSLALLESRPDIAALLGTGETVIATAGFPLD